MASSKSPMPVPESLNGTLDPRVYFAAQRTHLAWIRTGLALMGFGFVVARFGLFLRSMLLESAAVTPATLKPSSGGGLSLWFGVILILLGVAVQILATAQHIYELKKLRRGEILQPALFSTGFYLALLLALLGIAMAGYLFTVGN